MGNVEQQKLNLVGVLNDYLIAVSKTGAVHDAKLVYVDVEHTWASMYPNRMWRFLAKRLRPVLEAQRTPQKPKFWHRLPIVTKLRHHDGFYAAYIKGPYTEKRCIGYRIWPLEALREINITVLTTKEGEQQ